MMTVRVVTQVVAVPGCLGWPAAEAGACELNCKTKCDKEEITFHADLFMP